MGYLGYDFGPRKTFLKAVINLFMNRLLLQTRAFVYFRILL